MTMPPRPADNGDNLEQATPDRQVVELTRARDDAIVAVAAERERVGSAMQQCEYLASEIWRWRRKHEAAALELEEITSRLAHAQVTIQNMERSWFWRARLAWVRLRNGFAGNRR